MPRIAALLIAVVALNVAGCCVTCTCPNGYTETSFVEDIGNYFVARANCQTLCGGTLIPTPDACDTRDTDSLMLPTPDSLNDE